MTVGEMISAHHWRDALDNARRAEQAFRDTPLGAALTRYENALASAWQADCREGISDRALNAAWDRAKTAEREFRTLLAIATREHRDCPPLDRFLHRAIGSSHLG